MKNQLLYFQERGAEKRHQWAGIPLLMYRDGQMTSQPIAEEN